MAAFLMSKLAPAEVADFDALDRSQLSCGKPSNHSRASRIGRVGAGRRVLQVLVVNDEQDTTDAFVAKVRCWGHAARVASGGLAARRMAAAQHPDVVLLNMEMTLMDGCTVARRMRADFPSKDCLIVAVSRRADDVRRQQCVEAGIDLLLVKPVDSEVVETLLMLECARVNRSQADNAAALAAKGPSRIARKKSSVDEMNRVAKTSGARRKAGTADGQQP